MYSKKADRLVENLIKAVKEDAFRGSKQTGDRDAIERHARNAKYDLLNYIARLEEPRP